MPGHVEGRKADFVRLAGELRTEEVVASVQPPERVFATVERGERQLEVPWDAGAGGLVLQKPWLLWLHLGERLGKHRMRRRSRGARNGRR
jgi:hypothetical protein